MRLKKMLLLVAMALGAVAVAAPAAQGEAPEWYHGPNKLVGEEDLHVVGEFESTTGSGFFIGPCGVTYEGTASNVNGMASGSITGGDILNASNTCPTNIATCSIVPTLEGFPWSLTGTTVTEAPGVEINGVRMTIHYEGTNCPVPLPTLTAAGSTTGIVEEGGCLLLEEHLDDVFLTIAPVSVDFLGGFCDTTLTLG